jgi:hypothetical protein
MEHLQRLRLKHTLDFYNRHIDTVLLRVRLPASNVGDEGGGAGAVLRRKENEERPTKNKERLK